jgi:hypothetical protein
MRVTGVVVVLCAAVMAAGCTAARVEQVQPRDGRSGLQGAGTLEGRQIAVAQGLPELLVGDCDPPDGADDDVCVITGSVDGRLFVVSFENPAVLVEGETVPVVAPRCATPAACDAVTDGAIVTIKLDVDDPVAATGGSVTIQRIEPFRNYAGDLTLRLPTGTFSATFDVVPRPED